VLQLNQDNQFIKDFTYYYFLSMNFMTFTPIAALYYIIWKDHKIDQVADNSNVQISESEDSSFSLDKESSDKKENDDETTNQNETLLSANSNHSKRKLNYSKHKFISHLPGDSRRKLLNEQDVKHNLSEIVVV
jgi:hypothetical protein